MVTGGTGTVITNGVIARTGANAIADWVVVELRQPSSPYAVLATRTALVQRDGDVVGTDGTSPVVFDAAPGNYAIALRHRNHLGVMTSAGVALTSLPATVDFTNPVTATYGTNAQKQVGTKMTMWCGEVTSDGTVRYVGVNNDRDPILVAIGGNVPTNTVANTYVGADVNMDGLVKYVGANNDRDPILQTVGGSVPTASRVQQLP